ncbi:uncharacterized protein LOC108850718 [Raphanus sativus]|uniref:Uncharacterized protein LOC108850718 n=1 Tax=Raphanus sativus TaxID=3726 RepID=A0A9W3DJX1_RAPSA|nr:uncharacterized protein LOC108850718 [Raphanus sativus]
MNRPSNHVYKIEFMIQTSITDCNFTCDDNMFLDLHDFSTIIDDVIGVILDFGANDIVQGARKEVIKVEFTLGDIKFHGDRIVFDKNNNISDKLQINEKRLKWSQFPFLTIQEIKRSEKDGNCRLICSVYAIDTSDGWWYCACVVCESKVIKPRIIFGESDVPNWWCEICQHNVTKVSPRYKFDLLVQDQTGETKFTLPDSVATYIVKKSASKVVNVLIDQVKDQDMLPSEIVEIVGKSYGFGISVDKNNNSDVLSTFNAMKVWSLNDAIWKRTKSLHQNSVYSRKKQCTDLEMIDKSG